MINDIFNEQLVKRERTSVDVMMSVGLWTAAVVISIGLILFLPMVGPIIAVILVWAAYILNSRLKKEFEYSFTNGEMDIDVIYNQSKRKRLITIDSKKILAMEKAKSKDHVAKDIAKVLDYSSGTMNDNLYALTYNVEGQKTRIYIEPNESILKGIYSFAPRSATGQYGVSRTDKE